MTDSSNIPQGQKAQFSLFGQFPAEIRLKIWGIVLSTPRIVTITCPRPTNKTLHLPFKPITTVKQAFRSNLPPPALLHVNHEARSEALAVYSPYFKTSRGQRDAVVQGESYIYVNFALDTIRCQDAMLAYLADTELLAIRKLMLDVYDCAYFGHFNMDIVKSMKSLEKVDMWADRGDTYSWNYGDTYMKYLTKAFNETKELDPGWECPEVTVTCMENGLKVDTIAAGAKIPGWVWTANEDSDEHDAQTHILI